MICYKMEVFYFILLYYIFNGGIKIVKMVNLILKYEFSYVVFYLYKMVRNIFKYMD